MTGSSARVIGSVKVSMVELLSEEELLTGFEQTTLGDGEFPHRNHVRVSWLLLQRFEPAAVLERYVDRIKRLVAAHGAEEKYHETVTWAFLLLIVERTREGETWPEFAARNEDLLYQGRELLGRYYSAELLASTAARGGFLLPDRLVAPAA